MKGFALGLVFETEAKGNSEMAYWKYEMISFTTIYNQDLIRDNVFLFLTVCVLLSQIEAFLHGKDNILHLRNGIWF